MTSKAPRECWSQDCFGLCSFFSFIMACDSQLNVAISAGGEKDTKKIHPREYCCESEFPMRSRKSAAAPNCLRNTAHSRDTKSSVSEGSVSLQVCNLSAQTKQVLRIVCVLSVCSSTPSCAACSTVRRACTMLSNCLSQTTTFVRPPTTIIRAGLRSYTVHWALVADTCAYASQPLEVKNVR